MPYGSWIAAQLNWPLDDAKKKIHLSAREDRDATPAVEAKLYARAVVGRGGRGDRGRDLHDGKDVIIFRKSCGVLASDVRHILQPRARFRIDHAAILSIDPGLARYTRLPATRVPDRNSWPRHLRAGIDRRA